MLRGAFCEWACLCPGCPFYLESCIFRGCPVCCIGSPSWHEQVKDPGTKYDMGFPHRHPNPSAALLLRGQEVSPITNFVTWTSTIFGMEIHDPKDAQNYRLAMSRLGWHLCRPKLPQKCFKSKAKPKIGNKG